MSAVFVLLTSSAAAAAAAEFEALVLFISVLLASLMIQDGSSNWLKGAMLILTYLFVAAGFWVS